MAITLSKAAQAPLMVWVPISPCLTRAHLKGVTVNRIVVAVYHPMLDAEEEAKDSFYDDLQEAMDNAPSLMQGTGTQGNMAYPG